MKGLRKLIRPGGTAAFAAALALSAATAGHADDYPSRQIHVLVPFAAGGGTDIVTRIISEELERNLGVPVVVENRPAAGGIQVDLTVAQSAPDGYTFGIITPQFTINPTFSPDLPYDPLTDLTPVSLMTRHQYIVAAGPGYPADDVEGVIADARQKAGRLNYASGGSNGGGTHLAGALFMIEAGAEATHIAYPGSANAYPDVMTGRVDLIFTNIISTMPLVKSGELKAIAVTGPERASFAPDIPTVAESGLPGYQATSWFGIVGPAGLPPEILDKINAEIVRAIRSPEVMARLDANGVQPVGSGPEEFAGIIREEIEKWREVITKANIAR